MIALYQFPRQGGLPNPSPFCMKLETYLRMAGLAYETRTILRPGSRTGKCPYIVVDGETLTDSTLIINELERRYGHPVDGKLTLAQRGESLAFQRLLDEHLYWVAVYGRWVAQPAALRRKFLEGLGIPAPISGIAALVGKRRYEKVLKAQGLGRHPPEVIWQFGISDLQAMAHWLGNRPFAFGDSATVLDAALYSYVGNIVASDWENPLKSAALKHRNLVDHFTRMLARTFPELAR
ncbi:MAG: glutathione S-transferase family protein [Rhodospirillaceae bacterium]